jgi:hypothetical protein
MKKQAISHGEAFNDLAKLKAWAETKRLEAQKKAEEEATFEDVAVSVA